MYKILHCADLHLGSPLRGLAADPDAPADRLRGATRVAFTNLVNFAIEQDVAIVLVAGDIYDGNSRDSRTGLFLVRELERLTRAGIRVVAISGNHDASSVITRKFPWPDGAKMLSADRVETIRFPDLRLVIHGCGFMNKAVPERLINSYPDAENGSLNIGLLHTSAEDEGEHAKYAPCTEAELRAKRYDYWALGHIHKHKILSDDPYIVFPGNLQGRHIREEGAKGAVLITIEDGKIAAAPALHALDVVRWRRIDADLTGAVDEDAALAIIRHKLVEALAAAENRLLAVRIVLSGTTGAHAMLISDPGATRDKIRGEVLAAGGADVLWLEQVLTKTAPPAAYDTHDHMVEELLKGIQYPDLDALAAELQQYAAPLLDRVSGLRDHLSGEPAALAATGDINSLIDQARALLLAKLTT